MVLEDGVHCYEVLQNALNFQQSISDCQSRDTHLVTLTSQTEFDFVISLLEESMQYLNMYERMCVSLIFCNNFLVISDSVLAVHIDLNDEGNSPNDYQFTSHQETESPFFLWLDGQPDNNNDHCVNINVLNAAMNDVPCSTEYPRVCEIESEWIVSIIL